MLKTTQFLRNAGFTMIELLVVIAVIGVLAVAVLSSINPIEQINKGRDTRSRSDAAQLISAVDRYFAIHEKYPWNEDAVNGITGTFTGTWAYDSGDGYVTNSAPGGSTNDHRAEFEFDESIIADGQDQEWSWIIPIINTAEIKESFGNRLAKIDDNTDFFIKKPQGANRTMYVCFQPSSYAFDLEASNRCDSAKTDTYDQQLAVTDVPEACGDVSGLGNNCYDSLTDDNKCMICLP
jgi:prepilin-type N-terminal cleavage/methylation domain-containing protein